MLHPLLKHILFIALLYFIGSFNNVSFGIGFSNSGNNLIHFTSISDLVSFEPDTIELELFIGQNEQVCLMPIGLTGPVDTIFNYCQPPTTFVYQLIADSCFNIEGLTLGEQAGCFVVCDASGICDTTIIEVSSIPYSFRPGLVDDTTSTLAETPEIIDALSNDTILGGLSDYFILSPPISGQATINLDGSITYHPEEGFCARWDEFSYVACNPIGCDTATVQVFIECVELTIFNAVSPNNDGVNDYFYIAKIESIPNNRLWVYNRWGSLVFDSGDSGYNNNWPGTWGQDIDLPDGSYFYILEWFDSGTKKIQRGYIEMFR